MPIDIRARLVSAPREAGYSDSLLARQANYYGDSRSHRGADPAWLARSAREYEDLGYDSALIAQRSGWPDVWSLATWSLAATTRFSIAAAHRIGLQAPTAAARSLATLDQLSGGRITAHIILGSTEDDQKRDGDFLAKADRYRRAEEYLQIVRRWLGSAEPFDFDGEFYHVKDALAGYRPGPRPLLSYGGSSPESLRLAGRYADVYAVTAEPLAGTAELTSQVRDIAAGHGRTVSFWFSTPNVILGATDAGARRKADALTGELLVARDYQQARQIGLAYGVNERAESVNRQRWLKAVHENDWHDKALYTGIGRITGYGWPAFVGSPATIADALLDYYDLGVRVFGIGMSVDAREDRELATELFRLLRAGAGHRDGARDGDLGPAPATLSAKPAGAGSRIRGAIWGRLVADAAALGSHWIYDLDEQQRRFPGGPHGFEAPAAGHYHEGKSPGDQTHYGDGARLLLDVVAVSGSFDLTTFGPAFVSHFRPGTYPGYLDHATRGTLENYDSFVAAHPGTAFDFRRGADDDHPATVTRSSVVVARHLRDPDVLGRVEALTRLAQDNPTAVSYARADAVLLLQLLAGRPVGDALTELSRQFADAGTAEATAVADAVARARADQHRDTTEATLDYGQSCPLPNTFPAAVQILLRYPADFTGAVLAALRGGGDSAGRAALVGGWLGAHLGVEAIPVQWRDRLSGSERIGAAVDKIVADALGDAAE